MARRRKEVACKMTRFFYRLFLKNGKTYAHQPVQLPDNIRKLLRHIGMTTEVEYSCDEVYPSLDRFSEMFARSKDAALQMPLVRMHLEMCSDCYEEHNALFQILETAAA